ncbi:helix-turn-helix transcriptional regulator [Kitasatospora sp. NPDC049258]|uniref:helix-turn-helix transcriptional regulator n=1 Tax=Kitasatospora sp. NPDC049258 TaxID=3155394 RepID=UPI003444C69E
MPDTTAPDPVPRLDPAAVRLFDLALAHGRLDRSRPDREAPDLDREQFDRACELLLRLRLLRPVPQLPEQLVPMSPELAAAGVTAPLEEGIARAAEQVRAIREEFGALMPRYRSARQGGTRRDPVELLTDPVIAAAVFAEEAAHCREELFTVSPGGLPPTARGVPGPDGPDGPDGPGLAALARGARLRTLCRAVPAAPGPQRARISRLIAAGADYRALPELPEPATVIDRSAAFLARREPDGSPSTVLLRDPGAVAHLCQALDLLWAIATPCHTRRPAGGRGQPGSGVHRAVVRMLAEGAKDEVIARRLGVSLRTCRRHIAEILESLQADSRFQAGVLAERTGLTATGPPP